MVSPFSPHVLCGGVIIIIIPERPITDPLCGQSSKFQEGKLSALTQVNIDICITAAVGPVSCCPRSTQGTARGTPYHLAPSSGYLTCLSICRALPSKNPALACFTLVVFRHTFVRGRPFPIFARWPGDDYKRASTGKSRAGSERRTGARFSLTCSPRCTTLAYVLANSSVVVIISAGIVIRIVMIFIVVVINSCSFAIQKRYSVAWLSCHLSTAKSNEI